MPEFDDEFAQFCRQQYPALSRRVGDELAVFFDGPAGVQVPQRVIEAVGHYLGYTNANHGGSFATSRESDEILTEAHQAFADFVGAHDAHAVYFGANMTTLTFALSRAIAQTWEPDDEIILTRLDHDANVSPWVLAARDAGAVVHFVDIKEEDCTLDLECYESLLNEKTKLVAVGCASNSTGGLNPVKEMTRAAHEVGALVFLDAVHYAPHALIDVNDWDCDFLACSAYKFFGPHVGVIVGRPSLLESLEPYKVRPASNELPDRWMTGTQNHEGIAGAKEAVDYLADIGRRLNEDDTLHRRAALDAAFNGIATYERDLCRRLLEGLAKIDEITVVGITEPNRMMERLPTVSFVHSKMSAEDISSELGERGIFVWWGHYYAIELTETLGLEPEGMVRVGLVHYNTAAEVDRLLAELATFS